MDQLVTFLTTALNDARILLSDSGLQAIVIACLISLAAGAILKPIRGLLWPLALAVLALPLLVVSLDGLRAAGLLH